MGNEWKELLIQDVIELSSGKPLPPSFDKQKGRFPVLGSNGILGYCSEALVNEPVVTIGRVGACGSIHKSDKPTWISDNTLIAKPKENIDLKFIYYLFLSVDFKPIIGGTTQPLITQTAVKGLRVRIPKLKVQKAIASILGSIDDKIELNRQINEKLEAIAQALFKSWFIDFDPVRAKAEGRNTGLPEHISSLFPASFVDSELGQIPEGWDVTDFGQIAEILDSKRIPLSNMERKQRIGTIRYYGATGVIDYIDDYLFNGIYVLVGEDGSVINEDETPVVQYVWGKFWVNNHAHVLKGKSDTSEEELYLFLKNQRITPLITGAVQAKLSQSNMLRLRFIKANSGVRNLFGIKVKELFQDIRHRHDESLLLTQLRDTLLPKLISGELPIPDAERIVGRYL